MRASVVLLFAFLALAFVSAQAAAQVSNNIRGGPISSQSPTKRTALCNGGWWLGGHVLWDKRMIYNSQYARFIMAHTSY